MRLLFVITACLSLSAYGGTDSPVCEETYPNSGIFECNLPVAGLPTMPSDAGDWNPSTAFEKKPSFNPISGKNLLVGMGVIALIVGGWTQKDKLSKRRPDDPRSSASN